MFTFEQIKQAYAKVQSGADFPQFIRDLKAAGVISYENNVADGSTVYFGHGGFILEGEARYPSLQVQVPASVLAFKDALQRHQQGQSDYPAFCSQAAGSGVSKWLTDLEAMTVTYFDTSGAVVFKEGIPG